MAQNKRRYRLRWVDVFTQRALAGNPLAVVLKADGLSTEQMQAIARETNLSETTFVLPPEKRGHAAKVRIFTPYVELPFAGHPTVGTGWVLLDEGLVGSNADAFTLEEGVGPIPVRVDRGGGEVVLWMSHPPVRFGEVIEERENMAAALRLRVADLLPEVPIQIVSTGVPFVYVALKHAADVDRAVSTGEASGPLGAFAVRYGLIPRAAQVSIVSEQGTKMGRQSFVLIKLAYPAGAELPSRVEVGGSVVPVMKAELSING